MRPILAALPLARLARAGLNDAGLFIPDIFSQPYFNVEFYAGLSKNFTAEAQRNGYIAVQLNLKEVPYNCYIPTRIENQKKQAQISEGPFLEEVRTIIASIRGCDGFAERNDYWQWQVCHGDSALQFHLSTTATASVQEQLHVLGYENNSVKELSDLVLESGQYFLRVPFTNGELCDLTQFNRTADVLYYCDLNRPKGIVSVQEISTCCYEIVYNAPELCVLEEMHDNRVKTNEIACAPSDRVDLDSDVAKLYNDPVDMFLELTPDQSELSEIDFQERGAEASSSLNILGLHTAALSIASEPTLEKTADYDEFDGDDHHGNQLKLDPVSKDRLRQEAQEENPMELDKKFAKGATRRTADFRVAVAHDRKRMTKSRNIVFDVDKAIDHDQRVIQHPEIEKQIAGNDKKSDPKPQHHGVDETQGTIKRSEHKSSRSSRKSSSAAASTTKIHNAKPTVRTLIFDREL